MDYQKAVHLRATGQYHAALASLSTLSTTKSTKAGGPVSKLRIIIDSALCHLFQHQFNDVYEDLIAFQNLHVHDPCKEAGLMNLVYDYSRFHTDLALREAIQTAEEIHQRYVFDRNVQDLDPVDVQIVCLHHLVQHLGQSMLSLPRPDKPPLPSRFEELRLWLLQRRQFDDLAMIHLVEAETEEPPARIAKLHQTLDAMQEEDLEMYVYLTTLLAQALHANGEPDLAWKKLAEFRQTRLSDCNSESQLWAKYYTLRFDPNNWTHHLPDVEELLLQFKEIKNGYASQLCEFLISETHLFRGVVDDYVSQVQDLLYKSHALRLPARSEMLLPNQTTSDMRHAQAYSTRVFWLHYFDLITADTQSWQRMGLAVRCCSFFLDKALDCSIPEMNYTLAAVLADCYTDIGDMHQTFKWRQKAKTFAEETQDQDVMYEAEYELRRVLGDKTVKASDDPYGIKQQEWSLAQKLDLEQAYEEAKQRHDWDYQFLYAFELLGKELDEEVRTGQTPCGREWLPRALESLNHLPEDRIKHRMARVNFAVGHSRFNFGDYRGCVDALEDVLEMALGAADGETAGRALFTISRAYLHLYLLSRTAKDWDASRHALQRCRIMSEKRDRVDEVACCHALEAVLWHTRKADDRTALKTALHHITEVQRLWTVERGRVIVTLGLDGLLSKYALSGRNAKNPDSILGLAIDICYEMKDFRQAWKWADYGKAQAFLDGLRTANSPAEPDSIKVSMGTEVALPKLDESALFIHWVTVGDQIYMITCREGTDFQMFRLEITLPAVEEWHQHLLLTKEDLSDPESAQELLSELEQLCWQLVDPDLVHPGELLVFCPTRVLFKIPLHAIPIDGHTLLERHPIVYTHSFGVLKQRMSQGKTVESSTGSEIVFIANPTGDTPAGEESVYLSANVVGGRSYTRAEAQKLLFVDKCVRSQLVHFHGHVKPDAYALNRAMVFYNGEELQAREVFKMDLHDVRPVIVIIGCGSGIERLSDGDEPLGFISGYLYAGASAVIATMWPIHDRLAGAAFTEVFYSLNRDRTTIKSGDLIHLARRLQMAALHIKARPETRAPYFWAGFILHGDWRFRMTTPPDI